MDFFQLLFLNSNKLDYTKYIFIFILSYVVLFRLNNVFSPNNIFLFFIASILLYFYVKRDINNDFDTYKKFNKEIKEINIGKESYLKFNLKILKSLYKLQYLKTINKYCYKKTINYSEKFLKYFHFIKNSSNYPKKIYYSNMLFFKKKILNNLMSCMITFYPKKIYNLEEEIDYHIDKDSILKEINILDIILNNYIIVAKNIINKDWESNETNIYSNQITDLYPEENNVINKHYSIY